MKYILFHFILFYFSNGMEIKEAVYDIMFKDYYLNYENSLQISDSLQNTNFKITKIYENYNISFFHLVHINTKLKLFCENNSTNIYAESLNEQKDFSLWNFIIVDSNNYKIKNKKNCYIVIREFNITCEYVTLEEASQFHLIKIYEEVKENDFDNKIIENEPIDIIIKYIDLRDPHLNRSGIHQIKKDYDNEELRYCIRSILKNISWIRKIYIVMPNKKVRFFKEYNEIKDKIIYISDKDILGYDSSNSLAFQYRFWKMEKYGISTNFIIMDDDNFIGEPLNKTNFFYVVNGKVTPAIVTSKFMKLNKSSAEESMNRYKQMINTSYEEQSSPVFRYSLYLTYLFILKLFNDSLYIPIHTHNAIPGNINELKEVYDIIYHSKYKSETLDSLFRPIENIQFQAFVLSYTFYKYNKKVRNISYKLINNKDSIFENYNYSLFCINTGSENYSEISFKKTKIVLEYLFPNPTPYETIDSSLPYLAYNTVLSIDNELKEYLNNQQIYTKIKEDELNELKKKISTNFIFYLFINLFFLIFFKIIIKR